MDQKPNTYSVVKKKQDIFQQSAAWGQKTFKERSTLIKSAAFDCANKLTLQYFYRIIKMQNGSLSSLSCPTSCDELFLLKSMFYINDVKSFQVADGSINIVAYWG